LLADPTPPHEKCTAKFSANIANTSSAVLAGAVGDDPDVFSTAERESIVEYVCDVPYDVLQLRECGIPLGGSQLGLGSIVRVSKDSISLANAPASPFTARITR